MLIIIGSMLTGIAVGLLLRKYRLGWIHKVIIFLVWMLLFLLGIEAGSNPDIMNSLHTLGIEAIIITLGAIGGSILFSWALWYIIQRSGRKNV